MVTRQPEAPGDEWPFELRSISPAGVPARRIRAVPDEAEASEGGATEENQFS